MLKKYLVKGKKNRDAEGQIPKAIDPNYIAQLQAQAQAAKLYEKPAEVKGSKELRRGPWSEAEDALLSRIVPPEGPMNWVRIAFEISNRSPKQCRQRYNQNLRPTLKNTPIDESETEFVEDWIERHGKDWAGCAAAFGNRSENQLRGWWNSRTKSAKLRERSSEGHNNIETLIQKRSAGAIGQEINVRRSKG